MQEKSTRDILIQLLGRKVKADTLPPGEVMAHQAVYDLLCRRISAYMVKLLAEILCGKNAELQSVCAELVDIITRQDGEAFFRALDRFRETAADPLYQMGFTDYKGDMPWDG